MTDLENVKALLDAKEVPFPDPWMGSPFTEATICEEVDTDVIRYGPPCRPCREVYKWDELADADVYVRSLSDDEFDDELAQYNRDVKQWRKDGGQKIIVTGPPRFTGTFRTANGSSCEGIWTGQKWEWTGWEEAGTQL